MEEPTSMTQAASFPVHITRGQNIILRPSGVYNGLSGLSSRAQVVKPSGSINQKKARDLRL